MKRVIVVFALLVLHVGCTTVPSIENRPGIVQDKLASWQDGPVKSKIVAFVTAVCDPQSDKYVRAEDRRAFFDMDGTILCEKPEYIEVEVTKHRLREKATADPELAKRPLYKAALEYTITLTSMSRMPYSKPSRVRSSIPWIHTGETTSQVRNTLV